MLNIVGEEEGLLNDCSSPPILPYSCPEVAVNLLPSASRRDVNKIVRGDRNMADKPHEERQSANAMPTQCERMPQQCHGMANATQALTHSDTNLNNKVSGPN